MLKFENSIANKRQTIHSIATPEYLSALHKSSMFASYITAQYQYLRCLRSRAPKAIGQSQLVIFSVNGPMNYVR